jgi:hypothetical protein
VAAVPSDEVDDAAEEEELSPASFPSVSVDDDEADVCSLPVSASAWVSSVGICSLGCSGSTVIQSSFVSEPEELVSDEALLSLGVSVSMLAPTASLFERVMSDNCHGFR